MREERVSVVDEFDNVIATKSRYDLEPEDIIRVSVLWIENSRGDVLLQQRALTKKNGPGLWAPVAGTVEPHETYLSNIIKEAHEEIGLIDFAPIEVGKRLFRDPKGGFGRIFVFYRAVVNQDINSFTLQHDEVAELKWVPKASLLTAIARDPESYVPSAVYWPELYL